MADADVRGHVAGNGSRTVPIRAREYEAGKWCLEVCNPDGTPLEIDQVSKTSFTHMEVTGINATTWTAITGAVVGGAQINFQNNSTKEMRVRHTDADSGYKGMVLPANNGERQYFILQGETYYFKSKSGADLILDVEEIK